MPTYGREPKELNAIGWRTSVLVVATAAVMVLSVGSLLTMSSAATPSASVPSSLSSNPTSASTAATTASAASTTQVAPAASVPSSPHKGTLDVYEVSPGGSLHEDPELAYDSTSDEPLSNALEDLVTYNGSATSSFSADLATCVPGQNIYNSTDSALENQCNQDYGGNFTGIYNATGAAWYSANISGSGEATNGPASPNEGAPIYWTFVIDPAAHFYDPSTGKSWSVYPTDVMLSIARDMALADYSPDPGWILGQALLPTGNPSWDGGVHYPYNNTPENVLGSMLVNDTAYCPATAMTTMGNGCITFVTTGQGTTGQQQDWFNFLEFLVANGAWITSSGYLTYNGAEMLVNTGAVNANGNVTSVASTGMTAGWLNSTARDGDGSTLLPDGGTTTDNQAWTNYLASLKPYGWDTWETAVASTYPVAPYGGAAIDFKPVGSGPYAVSVDPYISYTLEANPAYEQPSGCRGDLAFAQVVSASEAVSDYDCLPAPGHYIANVDVTWETAEEGDSLGLNAISAGTADLAGFETTHTSTILSDVASGLWQYVPCSSLSCAGQGAFFTDLNLNVSYVTYNTTGLSPLSSLPGTPLAATALSNLALRDFITATFPYAYYNSTFNTVDGVAFDFLSGLPLPEGMGGTASSFGGTSLGDYAVNVSYPYEQNGGVPTGTVVAPSSTTFGSAGYYWNALVNKTGGSPDVPSLYNATLAGACTSSHPCSFYLPWFNGQPLFSPEVTDWASYIEKISGGALQVVTEPIDFDQFLDAETASNPFFMSIGFGWTEDYPAAYDFFNPMYNPNGDYTVPDHNQILQNATNANLYTSSQTNATCGHYDISTIAAAFDNLSYWASVAQNGTLSNACQGVAYDVLIANLANTFDASGTQAVLDWNLLTQVANALDFFVENGQSYTPLFGAPWLNLSTIDMNPAIGEPGEVTLYYTIQYAANAVPTGPHVTATETGLPAGVAWQIGFTNNRSALHLDAVGDINTTASGGSMSFYPPVATAGVTIYFNTNQTYNGTDLFSFDAGTLTSYSISAVTSTGGADFGWTSTAGPAGYSVNGTGSVNFVGSPVANITINVVFVKNPDEVTFQENGLSSAAVAAGWNVTVTCTTPATCGPASNPQNPSFATASSVQYFTPGTYGVQWAQVAGYNLTGPSEMNASSTPTTVTVTYTPTTPPVPSSAKKGFLGLPGDEGYYLVGGVATAIVVAAGATAFVMRSRKGKPPAEPTQPSPSTPGAEPPPGGGPS